MWKVSWLITLVIVTILPFMDLDAGIEEESIYWSAISSSGCSLGFMPFTSWISTLSPS